MGRRRTAKQRARQAEAIQQWRPWESSTGPRSVTGKLIASRNARIHAMRSTQWRDEARRLNKLLRECRARLSPKV
jgi:hypothetical protein